MSFFLRAANAYSAIRNVRGHPIRARIASHPAFTYALRIEAGLTRAQTFHDCRKIGRIVEFPCSR